MKRGVQRKDYEVTVTHGDLPRNDSLEECALSSIRARSEVVMKSIPDKASQATQEWAAAPDGVMRREGSDRAKTTYAAALSVEFTGVS